jgi:hypothetical protein
MGQHICPYPECEQRLPEQMFACKPHWFSLPLGVRQGIWRAYRREGVGSPELFEAHAAATEWWDAQRELADRQGRLL